LSELTSLGPLLFVQSKKGYRHNIDSVLIANFIQPKSSDSVLDVGSGDGIISIILNNRYPALRITGIEIQSKLFSQSLENKELNKSEVHFINDDFFDFPFSKNNFDIILTNPPYYPLNSGKCSKNSEKNLAKHEIAFNLENFLKKLIPDKGRRMQGFGDLEVYKIRVPLKRYNISKSDGLRIVFVVFNTYIIQVYGLTFRVQR